MTEEEVFDFEDTLLEALVKLKSAYGAAKKLIYIKFFETVAKQYPEIQAKAKEIYYQNLPEHLRPKPKETEPDKTVVVQMGEEDLKPSVEPEPTAATTDIVIPLNDSSNDTAVPPIDLEAEAKNKKIEALKKQLADLEKV